MHAHICLKNNKNSVVYPTCPKLAVVVHTTGDDPSLRL